MPQRRSRKSEIDFTASNVGLSASFSSAFLATVPPSRTRRSSQTHPRDPIRISQLPSSVSLLSGPGLSPPPPNRFRTLPKRVPAHLLGHHRSQSTPTYHFESSRRKVSDPNHGIRKPANHHKQTQSLPIFTTTAVPTILITASPDLPQRKVTPQSPIHLRVNRHRHHGPKQLRDRDHSHRALRDPSTSGLRHLGRAEQSQHIRQEGARNGGRPGRRLRKSLSTSPSPLPIGSEDGDKENSQPGMEEQEKEVENRVESSEPPPAIPVRNPRRTMGQLGTNTPSPDPKVLKKGSTTLQTHPPPTTPPATPPPPKQHSRTKSQSIGTLSLTLSKITNNDQNKRPLTPPKFSCDEVGKEKRTISGTLRWEDDRDSWF